MNQKICKLITRKRSFLLFELLVALGLIALCFYPLVKPLTMMRKADIQHLEQIQLEQHAQVAYCQIKQNLHEHRHKWEDLKKMVNGEIDIFTIVTGEKTKKSVPCTYEIRWLEHFNKKNPKKSGMVVEITIQMGKLAFFRTLYLERQLAI